MTVATASKLIDALKKNQPIQFIHDSPSDIKMSILRNTLIGRG
jgi:hypothetical protein